MARSASCSCTLVVTTILIAFILNNSAPATAADETCKESGEFCGGIVGYQCCEGLDCILDGDYADAGGECYPPSTCRTSGQFCGGFAAFECCKGLRCVLEGDYPDAGGHCKESYGYEDA